MAAASEVDFDQGDGGTDDQGEAEESDAAPAPQIDFNQGVASGEVTDESAVLWTRASRATAIKVEVFDNPALQPPKVFQQTVHTTAAGDFTAKAIADDLEPATQYWYRWRRGNQASAVGTFRTAPEEEQAVNVRFTFSGDTDGSQLNGAPFFNHFEVLDAARAENSDFFIYLGDLIYSDSFVRGLAGTGPAQTLDEYRKTWKVNRGFAALRSLLAALPIFSIWDDHEVLNDYDGQTVDPVRYANGRQAYFEYLPTAEENLLEDPVCAGDPLFKVFHYGAALDLIIPDERSCRSADVADICQGDVGPTLPPSIRGLAGLPATPPAGCLTALFDPSRTFLGPVQKQALKDALASSTAKFKVIVNELPIQQFWVLPYDRWEGYAAERNELLNFIGASGIQNVVFLSTDIHANLTNQVVVDTFTAPQPVATEFVTGPVARNTFAQNVVSVAGPQGLALLQLILANVAKVECQALDAFSYGLAELDAGAGTLTVTLKDQNGNVVSDDLTHLPCTQTLGP